MKNTQSITLMLATMLALIFGSVMTASAGQIREIPFVCIDGAFVIDGLSNDGGWKGVPSNDFTSPEYNVLQLAGDCTVNLSGVKVAKTGDYLITYLQAENTQTDGKIWIGVSPDGKAGGNARCKIYVIEQGQPLKWFCPNAPDTMNTSTGKTVFSGGGTTRSAEVAIPCQEANLPLQDSTIGYAIAYFDSGDGSGGTNWVGTNDKVFFMDSTAQALSDVKVLSASAQTTQECADLRSLKQSPAGQNNAAFGGWVVTKAGPDYFYIEGNDRLTGLRVSWPSSSTLSVGSNVFQLLGSMGASANGEPMFTATSIYTIPMPIDPPGAFGMNSNALSIGGTGKGISNLSLRVRIAGAVKSADMAFFVISDGGKDTKIMTDAQTIKPTGGIVVGKMVGVTGVCSVESGSPVILATEVNEY